MTSPWVSPCGRATLHLGDCLDIIPTLEPGSVDAVMTDPPYGFQGGDDEGRRRNIGVYSGNGPHPSWRELDCADWNTELPLDWIDRLMEHRILAPGAALIAFTDSLRPHLIADRMEQQGVGFRRLLYWVKTNPPSNPSKNFMSSVEVAVFGRAAGPVRCWRGGGCRKNILTCAKVDGIGRFHPTEKPVQVMTWCLDPVTHPGMTVLDPYMGSGTTGVACILGDRRFIGVERDETYWRAAVARLAAECAQGRLPGVVG